MLNHKLVKVVFFGSSKYSVIVAKNLLERFGLSAVVTTSDKPVGRGKILTPNPVKLFALENHIPVITALRLDGKIAESIKNLSPDFLVIADFGLILPNELLSAPKYAPLNVHHSLLPKYRGPSPAPTAILNGDKISGVTIIKMSEKLDGGEILAQKEYALKPDETTDSLLARLNELGSQIIIPVIEHFKKYEENAIKQDESRASFTRKITKEDGYIDLDKPHSPQKLDRMIRAYYPWPGVWSRQIINNKSSIIKFLPQQKLQVEGKKPMTYKDFLNGYTEAKTWLLKLFPVPSSLLL